MTALDTFEKPVPRTSGSPDVLMVISHLGHGGTQRVVCNLANALVSQGFGVRVLLTKRRSNNALALDPSVELDFLVYNPPRWTFAHLAGLYSLGRWLPKLRKAISESKAPCVVSFIRPTNVKVLIACLGLRNQRFVVCERNDPERQPLGRHWAVLSRLLYRTADLVTINSRGVRSSLSAYVEDSKLAFLPNPLTRNTGQDAKILSGPAFLAVGRIVHQKGYDILIKAFAKGGDRLAGWRIVFLGEGPERKNLEKLAQELGVAERIEWHGHVSDPFAYYRAAAVFMLTSRYEGMPNALLEAMSCGLPSIVSDASPGPLEIIEHEKTGLVIATDNVAETAAAMTRLALHPEERERLGAAAVSSVKDYLPESSIDKWKEALGLMDAAVRPTTMPRPHHHPEPSPPMITRLYRSSPYLITRQIGHFTTRPRLWPHLARWLYKRIKSTIAGKDEAARAKRSALTEGTAWCESLAQSPDHALAGLNFRISIESLQERFPEALSDAKTRVNTVPFRLGGATNMDLVYALCEALKATHVIETGVANGWSSLAILLSISSRPGAKLHSIDLPYLKYQNDPWVGIAVPEDLKPCWTLHRKADREGLPEALKALPVIDFAHYDSDKSMEGRAFAYPLLWAALRPGGILFSDDINDNLGFRDFCDSVRQNPIVIKQGNKFQGILQKPITPINSNGR